MEEGRVYDANKYDWLRSGNGPNITYAHNTVYRTSLMKRYLPLFCEHVMYDDVSLQIIPISIAESFVYTKLNVYRYFIGHSGQSFDPMVRAKNGDHVTTVLKFVLAWMKINRDVVPPNTTRKDWFDDLWSAFGTNHYYELSLFPYRIAKPRLKQWDAYMRTEFPEVKISDTVYDYRNMTFLFYFVKFKIKRQFDRLNRYVHRNK